MLARERFHHVGGCPTRIDRGSSLREIDLQAREFVHADLLELLKRNVDHVAIFEHAAIGVGADRVLSRRVRHQIMLEPSRVVFDRRDQFRIRPREVRFVWTVRQSRECERHIAFEKRDRRGHLLQRDFDRDSRSFAPL